MSPATGGGPKAAGGGGLAGGGPGPGAEARARTVGGGSGPGAAGWPMASGPKRPNGQPLAPKKPLGGAFQLGPFGFGAILFSSRGSGGL